MQGNKSTPSIFSGTMNRQAFLLAVRLGATALLLLLLHCTGWLDFEVWSRVTFGLLMAPLPFYIFAFLVGIYRWRCLVRAVNIPISLWDVTRLTMTGIWVSSVLPGGSVFAGDATRAALFPSEKSNRRATVLASVFLDRLLGMLAIFVIAATALFLNVSMMMKDPWLQKIGLIVVSMIVLSVSMILISVLRKPHDFLTSSQLVSRIPGHGLFLKVFAAFDLFRNCRSAMIKAHLASYLGHGSMICAIIILAKHIGIQLDSPSEYVFAIAIGIVSAMIPVSGPVGLGAGNVGFAASFALLGSNDGAALALVWQATFVVSCQIGLPFFLIGRRTSTLLPPGNSGGVKKVMRDRIRPVAMERAAQ